MKPIVIFISFLAFSSCFDEEKFNRSVASLDFHNNTDNKAFSDYEKGQLNNLMRHLLNPEIFSGLFENSKLSPLCHRDFREYLNSLMEFQLWALHMFDASAKYSTGVLSGNINNFGDFDECLQSHSLASDIDGQYCLAYVKIDVPDDLVHLNKLKKLSHSLETFKSNFTKGFDDMYHYTPMFSSFFWASCIPSTCDYLDFQRIAQNQFNDFFNGTSIDIKIKSHEKLCQTKSKDVTVDLVSRCVVFFFTALFVFIFFATLYDTAIIEKNSVLTSFSLMRNWKELVTMEDSKIDEIKSVHGVRFFAVLMIFISHKSFFAYFYPMANRTQIIQQTFAGSTVPIRAGNLYTELFLMISGLLASYSLTKKIEQSKRINFVKEYFDRYLRIAPSLAAVILFLSYVLPYIGTGPLYKMLTEREAELCINNGWRNMLLINVWYGVKPMCAFHTQHVAVDFELFVFAPVFITLIYKWPKKGLQLVGVLAIVANIVKAFVAYEKNLSEFIIQGMTSQQVMDTGDFIYMLPPYRFTSYAIGIMSGYYLRKIRDIKVTSMQLYCVWGLLLAVLSISFKLSAVLTEDNYEYDPLHAAWMSFLPIPFCAFFALLIFSSELKLSNLLSSVLEWRGFRISTKVSYNFYLVQFVVFYFNTGIARGSMFYNLVKTSFDLNELIFIVGAALILTLCVEMPVKNLRNLFDRDKKSSVAVTLLEKKIE